MFFKETIQGVYYAAHYSILVLDQVLAKRGACPAKAGFLNAFSDLYSRLLAVYINKRPFRP